MEWSLTGVPLPIVLRPPSPWTDDELLDFSRRNKPYRIEKTKDGDVTIMTPAGRMGGKRQLWIASDLLVWATADGRGEVNGPNAGWNLPDGSTLSPDASWIDLSRVQHFTSEESEKYLPLCPDFVVEVRSKSDSNKILHAKMQTWLDNGAKLVWMFDPYKATVTIFRPSQEPEMLTRPEVIEGEGPVAGFRLTTAKLWAETPD